MFPFYAQDIVNLQYKTIESMNESVVFGNNTRKRKRFCMFTENLVKKNNDIIEKIRQKEEEDNNIDNYEKVPHDEEQELDQDISEEDGSQIESDDDSEEHTSQGETEEDSQDGTGYTETIYEESIKKKKIKNISMSGVLSIYFSRLTNERLVP
jgi:cobalamin biosynthesis protein CobT